MSQTNEKIPFRIQLKTTLTNFLQKYRTLLITILIALIVLLGLLAIWTQIDLSRKNEYAARIDKSQAEYTAWKNETDLAKKNELGRTFEADLLDIQKNAPVAYALLKAYFLHGTYWAEQQKWKEAAGAFRMVFEKDASSYLAPIALVNAAVASESAGDLATAIKTYQDFEKKYSTDAALAPQVMFNQGRLLEAQKKPLEAIVSYKHLLEKFPEASWTKLARDRIISLSSE